MNRLPRALQLIGIGWYFAICIVLGVVGGALLDQVTGTTVLFTLVGLLLGLVAAAYGGYRMLTEAIGAPRKRSTEHKQRR